MYDERSSWNNVTRRTLHAMQLAIVEYGVDQGILEMVPGQKIGPLDLVNLSTVQGVEQGAVSNMRVRTT